MRNICKIDNCSNYCKGKGFCSKHYAKFLKYNDPLKEVHNFKHNGKCNLFKCDNKYYGKGLCKKHYDQLPYHVGRRKKSTELYNQNNREKVNKWSKDYLNKLGQYLSITSSKYKLLLINWSKLIKMRDNYECQICGSIENLESHHIIYKKNYPLLSLNTNNGITLCRFKCHKELHGGHWNK